MTQQTTILMDRSSLRVSPRNPVTLPPGALIPAPGTPVFYIGKNHRLAKRIGIATMRIGIVDAAPIDKSGALSVSFERLPKAPKPGEEVVEDVADKAPEGFLLHPSSLRAVPASVLAKREAAKRTAAEQIQA